MGVVYAGHDEALDREVAIKLVHPHAGGTTGGRARVVREAQALARLSHPNVVQVYEVGEHEGQLFVAMEHVRGETLDVWQRRPGRRLAEILEAYRQAATGLKAAHDAGLVHRDFKPETWSPSRSAPLPPTGRILKNRGDLRGGLRRWASRRVAVLATDWQRAERYCSRS
jgi:serine/threonine protein kinase